MHLMKRWPQEHHHRRLVHHLKHRTGDRSLHGASLLPLLRGFDLSSALGHVENVGKELFDDEEMRLGGEGCVATFRDTTESFKRT